MWGRQALSLKLNEAGRPGPLAYPQAVWGRQVLILKLNEAGRPAQPTCLSSSCVGPPGAWPQAERGGQTCATHLLILKLCEPVWGRQALILKLKEAGRPAQPACLSSTCMGPPGTYPQAEGGGQACATHLLILKLCGAARRLASS